VKRRPLEIELADVAKAKCAAPLLGTLIAALRMARGRKQSRSLIANRMVARGYADYRAPHADTWRDLLARYLRRTLPSWCAGYVGGHHIAIHARRPTIGGSELDFCLARFVEVKPI